MAEDDHAKRWWQTLPALMSGLGTFLLGVGAVLGFFYGSHHAESELRDQNQTASTASVAPATSTSAETPRRTSGKPTVSAPLPDPPEPAIDRPPYFVSLPDKREYALNAQADRAVYMLLRAKVTPQTPESDRLRLSVRVINRNQVLMYVLMDRSRFQLIAEDRTFRPEDFQIIVPLKESRDIDVDFILPANLGPTTLRMMLWEAQVDIPFNLTPPQESEKASGNGAAAPE